MRTMLSANTSLTTSNCSDTENHHHKQNTLPTTSQTNCNRRASSAISHMTQSSGSTGGCISNRRKSSLSYQQQMQLASSTTAEDAVINSDCSDSLSGRFSPHPNELFLNHHNKLSIQAIDRYDDAAGCCLPPPSPAPNNDRYIVNTGTSTFPLAGNVPAGANNVCGISGNTNQCVGIQHNQPMHIQYNNYECNIHTGHTQQHQLHNQQQHHQNQVQPLPSPASSSSLSTHSGSISSTAVNTGSQLPGTSAAVTNNINLTQKYVTNAVTTMQCSISPNSRFRMSDRFREMPSKSMVDSSNAAASGPTRYVSSAHFLTQSTPLVASDTYTYLSSTVHTPVKRYVPTPPPTNEHYPDTGMPIASPTPLVCTNASSATGVGNKCNITSSASTFHNTPQQVNTLPYRFRMKCCANEQAPMQQLQPLPASTTHMPPQFEQRSLSAADYYATSPRTRSTYNHTNNICTTAASSISCNNKELSSVFLNDQQQMQLPIANTATKTNIASNASSYISSGTSSSSSASSTASPVTVGGAVVINGSPCVVGSRQPIQSTLRSTPGCILNDYMSRTPSIEYMNTTASVNGGSLNSRTPDPIATNITSSGSGIGSTTNNSNTSAATCLHCNTVRRTTGVHQTTQTTGPISPIPLPQLNDGVHCLNSLQTTHEYTSSSLTPSTAETHNLPLSPSSNTLQIQQRTQHKFVETTEQHDSVYGQQQQTKSQIPPQLQSIASQISLPDRVSYSNSCNQQLQQQQQIISQQTHSANNRKMAPQQSVLQQQQQPQLPVQQRFSRKRRLNNYLRKEVARFFGVEATSEVEECALWHSRQRRLALRRFGVLKTESEIHAEMSSTYNSDAANRMIRSGNSNNQHYQHAFERPDILPAQDAEDDELSGTRPRRTRRRDYFLNADFQIGDRVERKASVASMIMSSLTYIIHAFNKRQPRHYRQWSRSFAPVHVNQLNSVDNPGDICEGLTALQEDEVFFDSPGTEQATPSTGNNGTNGNTGSVSSVPPASGMNTARTSSFNGGQKFIEHQRQIYIGERVHGWRTSAIIGTLPSQGEQMQVQQSTPSSAIHQQQVGAGNQQHQPQHQNQHLSQNLPQSSGTRGNRISAQLLDGVLENSHRPLNRPVKLFSVTDLDDRTDHRPFFTYWINTVQILVLFLSLICYGIGPIGIGVEQKTGQVLVTSLSLQTVQHTEQRNVWIGPRNSDLVHMGAKFATCMRRDVKIMDVQLKTRRQERETACCIRNDDSGCVQSSQADCSVRGLFPTKSISTWKKWSPGESGPGGRISGSVCGLDPKYCDAPASIAPYEWPDDITKWPICRKTNSFSQRFRYKDHTAEHMVCEVIGHPCCTGVYGECRITTREYCDFVNGYFHEEASLCSQISCLNNVCGMFPFFSIEIPDQFYRLFTSLCLHAGILHLAITVAFQHIFLADLERLIGPIRTAIVYIGSGLAGNLTSAVLVPYKPEVGPLASLSGVVASLVVLLILIHWKHLRKPHVALFKLIFTGALLFGIGTLPWQLNFAGLLAGIICGIFLTIALVPFVSISKYGRKAKINLIWSCLIFHMLIYSIMLVIFYVFPTELTNLHFGEGWSNSLNPNTGGNNLNNAAGDVISSGISSDSNRHSPMHQQFYYHHHSDDIVKNGALTGDSKIALLIQSQTQKQNELQHRQDITLHHRESPIERSNFSNSTNRIIFDASYLSSKNNVKSYMANIKRYLNSSKHAHDLNSNNLNMIKTNGDNNNNTNHNIDSHKNSNKMNLKKVYNNNKNVYYNNYNNMNTNYNNKRNGTENRNNRLNNNINNTNSSRTYNIKNNFNLVYHNNNTYNNINNNTSKDTYTYKNFNIITYNCNIDSNKNCKNIKNHNNRTIKNQLELYNIFKNTNIKNFTSTSIESGRTIFNNSFQQNEQNNIKTDINVNDNNQYLPSIEPAIDETIFIVEADTGQLTSFRDPFKSDFSDKPYGSVQSKDHAIYNNYNSYHKTNNNNDNIDHGGNFINKSLMDRVSSKVENTIKNIESTAASSSSLLSSSTPKALSSTTAFEDEPNH